MNKRFNVTAVIQDPAVRTNNGSVELPFLFNDINGNSSGPRKLFGMLKPSCITDDILKRCIIQCPDSRQNKFTFHINLPEAGEFGFEVYANDPQKDGG